MQLLPKIQNYTKKTQDILKLSIVVICVASNVCCGIWQMKLLMYRCS